MTPLHQHLVRILNCDKRFFTLTAPRVDALEKAVFENADVTKEYDEQREKYIYSIRVEGGLMQFESKNRGDALCKLILRVPALHEPLRQKYNDLIKERFKSKRDLRKEREEARYQRRLALIRQLNSQEY